MRPSACRFPLALILCLLVGLHAASAQDLFDGAGQDVPEWLEDYGYEDGYEEQLPEDFTDEPIAVAEGQTSGAAECSNRAQCRRQTLTGDWCGIRPCLQQSGITYRGRVTQFGFGVAGGIQPPVPGPFAALGIAGGDAFEYTGNSQHDLLVDLDKFGGLPHSKFVVTLENIWGRYSNVSLETGSSTPSQFNTFFPVDPEANGVPRLTNFLYVQPLSKRLILSVGKARLIGTADRNIFAGGDGSDQFMNQTFIGNPLFIGQLSLSAFTVSAIMPREWGNMSLTVIDPKERSATYFEFDSLFSEGYMLFGQIRVNTDFFNKPGEHHIGGYYKNVDLLDLKFSPVPPTYPYPPAPPGTPKFLTRPESYTVFYGFDQYLAVYDQGVGRREQAGWGLFGRAGISDDGSGNPNFSAWHVSGGIGGDSPLPARRGTGDRFGIGYGFTATSTEWGVPARNLFGPRDTQVFEAYYRYMLTPSISVSPDLQWIKGNLGGLTAGRDAFVYGMRMNVRL